MSYDRQIDQLCTHQVVEEALYVGTDRLTIRPMRPIASAGSVRFRLNGLLEVPSYGVRTVGQVLSTRKGPYNITAGQNDTLAYRVGLGALQTIQVPTSRDLTPTRLCDLLNPQVSGLLFKVSGDRVQICTQGEGREAAFFLGSASTLAIYLGIAVNHEYRGQQVVPGWTLVFDPRTLADRPTRLLIFDAPLRTSGDFIEVSYSTIRQECRRCGGTGVEHDWRYGANGEVGQVRDEALFIQEIQKLFFTEQGSNSFHTWYGTQLMDLIGKKLTAGSFIQNLIVSDIHTAFKQWQSIKTKQEEKVGQYVSDEEFPFRLVSVTLDQSDQDPTVITVNMTIQNRSRKPIQLTRGLKLPMPTDLLRGSQSQGLIRQSLSQYVLTR